MTNVAVASGVTGLVFNIQRYSIHDGPGIRTTIFLKSCPLRCWWCSNPESQKPIPEVAHRDSLCNSCGYCVEACPRGAISLAKKKGIRINRRLCNNCGECVTVCIPGALKLFGQRISVQDVFSEVVKDLEFYRNSGGGVTASGGEPLVQPVFVAGLFQRCQESGIHTCLDTCGCAGRRAWELVLPVTNLVLFDIKLGDSEKHAIYTGKPKEQILASLKMVVQNQVPVIARVPLIPGINDSEEELKSIGAIISEYLGHRGKVNILPYHRYGLGKYQMLDRRYKLHQLQQPSAEQLKRAKGILESFGLDCEVMG